MARKRKDEDQPTLLVTEELEHVPEPILDQDDFQRKVFEKNDGIARARLREAAAQAELKSKRKERQVLEKEFDEFISDAKEDNLFQKSVCKDVGKWKNTPMSKVPGITAKAAELLEKDGVATVGDYNRLVLRGTALEIEGIGPKVATEISRSVSDYVSKVGK